MVRPSLQRTGRRIDEQVGRWQAELKRLENQMGREDAEVRPLILKRDEASIARLAELNARLQEAERRQTELRQEIASVRSSHIDETQLASALTAFDRLREQLSTAERARMLEQLIERVDYDGGDVAITFRPTGAKAWIEQGLPDGEEAQ